MKPYACWQPGAGYAKIPLAHFPLFHESSLMVNCSDLEELNTKYRIATSSPYFRACSRGIIMFEVVTTFSSFRFPELSQPI
jgi:hypothetical protein